MSSRCYKCRKKTEDLKRVDYSFRCGECKDYDNGFGESNPFPGCSCLGICFECERKRCQVCGNIKREATDDFASDCKICGRYNMLELKDESDTDGKGNWIDKHGKIIGSCEVCIYCNNKTACRKCAIAKFDKQKNQTEKIKDLQRRVKILEEKLKKK
jgi:hypothetical protein